MNDPVAEHFAIRIGETAAAQAARERVAQDTRLIYDVWVHFRGEGYASRRIRVMADTPEAARRHAYDLYVARITTDEPVQVLMDYSEALHDAYSGTL